MRKDGIAYGGGDVRGLVPVRFFMAADSERKVIQREFLTHNLQHYEKDGRKWLQHIKAAEGPPTPPYQCPGASATCWSSRPSCNEDSEGEGYYCGPGECDENPPLVDKCCPALINVGCVRALGECTYQLITYRCQETVPMIYDCICDYVYIYDNCYY